MLRRVDQRSRLALAWRAPWLAHAPALPSSPSVGGPSARHGIHSHQSHDSTIDTTDTQRNRGAGTISTLTQTSALKRKQQTADMPARSSLTGMSFWREAPHRRQHPVHMIALVVARVHTAQTRGAERRDRRDSRRATGPQALPPTGPLVERVPVRQRPARHHFAAQALWTQS